MPICYRIFFIYCNLYFIHQTTTTIWRKRFSELQAHQWGMDSEIIPKATTSKWEKPRTTPHRNIFPWFFSKFPVNYFQIARHCSKRGQQYLGQFFTPVSICELMVLCTRTEKGATGKCISDPTCGSGRLLLAYQVHFPGNYLVGEDISRTCCMMTVCNMLIHGCVGEVICHDSLMADKFTDGWKVNPTL